MKTCTSCGAQFDTASTACPECSASRAHDYNSSAVAAYRDRKARSTLLARASQVHRVVGGILGAGGLAIAAWVFLTSATDGFLWGAIPLTVMSFRVLAHSVGGANERDAPPLPADTHMNDWLTRHPGLVLLAVFLAIAGLFFWLSP